MLSWCTKGLLHTIFVILSYGYIRGNYGSYAVNVHYNTVYTSVSIMLQLMRTSGKFYSFLTLSVESSSGSTHCTLVYIIDDIEEFTLTLLVSDVASDIQHSPSAVYNPITEAIQTRAQLSFWPGHTCYEYCKY